MHIFNLLGRALGFSRRSSYMEGKDHRIKCYGKRDYDAEVKKKAPYRVDRPLIYRPSSGKGSREEYENWKRNNFGNTVYSKCKETNDSLYLKDTVVSPSTDERSYSITAKPKLYWTDRWNEAQTKKSILNPEISYSERNDCSDSLESSLKGLENMSERELDEVLLRECGGLARDVDSVASAIDSLANSYKVLAASTSRIARESTETIGQMKSLADENDWELIYPENLDL